jgi:hypothetical protein
VLNGSFKQTFPNMVRATTYLCDTTLGYPTWFTVQAAIRIDKQNALLTAVKLEALLPLYFTSTWDCTTALSGAYLHCN